MFRNRNNTQKPADAMYETFRASFPHLGTARRRSSSTAAAAPHGVTSPADALDVGQQVQASGHVRPFGEGDDIKDMDPTPRGSNEPWRLTPSMLDPNSFAFHSFANQPPGYYTPTPGGTNTIYHHQAGDLHTPSGLTMGLGTPLSLPTSEGALHAAQQSAAPVGSFSALAPLGFQNTNPFAVHHQHQPQHHQHHPQSAGGFAPHQFHHAEPGFHPMDQHHDHHTMGDLQSADVEMHEQSPGLTFPTHAFGTALRAPMSPNGENFRFHATLNAPTAMIKHADEIPVTYLNKGQAYSVSVVDTSPQQAPALSTVPPRYRTFVRISFEDAQQRQRPAACWQLWKEGRGTNEAHHRGGRLQAVEFVDPAQGGGGEVAGRPRLELESASFDGFCVTWSPPPNAPAECAIPLRFNFLSTDFSHSKGVKGIPVRLCAKTEQLVVQSPTAGSANPTPETCYCKVKLFRDHGAERKLANDIQHVKKSIDKLKQQIAQLESGMKDFGKRKRSSSGSKAVTTSAVSRPGKVLKHKRTWSMSSATSDAAVNARPAPEEDLHIKLQTLTDMFTSTRPASVLYLRGEELDDPDLHPVTLGSGGDISGADLSRINTLESSMGWGDRQASATRTSSIVSPTPSNRSMQSGDEGLGSRRESGFQRPTPFRPLSRVSSNEWRNMGQTATGDIVGVLPSSAGAQQYDHPVRLPKRSVSSDQQANLAGWIEAVGVDSGYQPPPERAVKPVACFYVQFAPSSTSATSPIPTATPTDNYYRAIYLMQRTLKDLIHGLATKSPSNTQLTASAFPVTQPIEPAHITRVVRVHSKSGLHILVDDESVRELPEGQDMVAEFVETQQQTQQESDRHLKREWDAVGSSAVADEIQVDGDIGFVEDASEGVHWEVRLHF